MTNRIPSEDQIRTFVDAGAASVRTHAFISEELNKKAITPSASMLLTPDTELDVYFRLNQTGNIFYSTSEREVRGDAKDLFDSVVVLFAAMTKAMAAKNKDLFDYEAWKTLIANSGYFVEVSQYQADLTIENSALTIDTQIIQQLLPGITSGNSMQIAKGVLNAINGKYSAATVKEDTKFGHVLFICEELCGAASVTVKLYYASKASHKAFTASPCHTTSKSTFVHNQQASVFLFVSPDTIAKFAGKFSSNPTGYKELVGKLSEYIK